VRFAAPLMHTDTHPDSHDKCEEYRVVEIPCDGLVGVQDGGVMTRDQKRYLEGRIQ